MKKTIICILIVLCLMTMCCTAESDIFYYNHNNQEVNETLENKIPVFKLFAGRFLENFYLPEGQPVDESLIEFDFESIFCDYDWNAGDVLNFLEAEDKAEFLKNLSVFYYYIPVYYDGVRLPYVESLHQITSGKYKEGSFGNYMADKPILYMSDQSQVAQRIRELSSQEYTPLLSIRLGIFWFSYAEKDGQPYLILINVGDKEDDMYFAMQESNADLLEQRIMNMEEAGKFLRDYQTAYDALPKNTNLVGGTSSEKTPNKLPWTYWFIGGAIVIIVTGAVITALLFSKKKSKI